MKSLEFINFVLLSLSKDYKKESEYYECINSDIQESEEMLFM